MIEILTLRKKTGYMRQDLSFGAYQKQSENLEFVHSLLAGVEMNLKEKDFHESYDEQI